MEITCAHPRDLAEIIKLEKSIEGKNAASRATLISRLATYPEGFLVAKKNHVVGYAESCLWNKSDFQTFEEIKDFQNHHKSYGRILYVIFVAVDPAHRREGIGSGMIANLQGHAANRNLDKVQLVAKSELVEFYGKLGFKPVRNMPRFLPGASSVLMEYSVNQKDY